MPSLTRCRHGVMAWRASGLLQPTSQRHGRIFRCGCAACRSSLNLTVQALLYRIGRSGVAQCLSSQYSELRGARLTAHYGPCILSVLAAGSCPTIHASILLNALRQ